MGKSLVIVESPAKAKTLGRYGRKYTVKASVGHLKDLPKSRLGVEVEHDFKPHYHVIPGKEKIVRELKTAARDSDDIYLAADPDSENRKKRSVRRTETLMPLEPITAPIGIYRIFSGNESETIIGLDEDILRHGPMVDHD